MYQIVAGNSPISLELQIITHDGDSGNTTTNSDLDMYVLDTDQNSVSQGASLEKVENAEVPEGAGDIYYIYIVFLFVFLRIPGNISVLQGYGNAIPSDVFQTQILLSMQQTHMIFHPD